MPDHTQIGADSLVIDMARRFATERLAPGAAAREKAGAIEPEIVASSASSASSAPQRRRSGTARRSIR